MFCSRGERCVCICLLLVFCFGDFGCYFGVVVVGCCYGGLSCGGCVFGVLVVCVLVVFG